MAVTALLQDLRYFLFPSPSPPLDQQPIPTVTTYNPPFPPSPPPKLRSLASRDNTGQHGPLFHHSEAHSPHTSTSRVAPEVIPGPQRISSAVSPRMSAAAGNTSDSQIHSPPRLSGARHIPLPPTVQGHVELNPLLRSGRGVLIRYRLVAPPTAASAFGTNDRWMLEAATSPHLRSMTIITSELIPWPIIVHASNANLLVVTVGDVLTAVHDALHTLVTECVEYQQVSLPNMVVASRHWNGMRRISLLNGRHWWAGLSESQEGPEIWTLHLQR